MKVDKLKLFIKQVLIALILIIVAVFIRIFFFQQLGRGIPYLTFYPIVALAALFGSFVSGITVTGIAFFLTYFWIQKGSLSYLEILAEVVFVLSCVLISIVGGSSNKAKNIAIKAKEELRKQNEKLLGEIKSRHEIEVRLNQKVKDLGVLNKYMVGRELKMLELKKQINELEKNSKINLKK